MIQIIFPQLNNHKYENNNPDYEKSMKFYLDEAIINLQISIPKETRFCLTINDQVKDISKDLIRLQVNRASQIKIFFIIQIQITITFQEKEEKIIKDFNSFDNLFQLEKQIKTSHNLFFYELNFFYKQNILKKDKSLRDLSISNDCIINCQIMGTYQIKYQIEQLITINIFSTLDQVYQQIQELFHLKQEFQLYSQEELLKKKQLDQDLLFYDYQIKPYSEIQLKLSSKVAIQVYIDSIQILQYYMISEDMKLRDFQNYLIELYQIDKDCSYQFIVENEILYDDYLISQLQKKQLNKVFTLEVLDESIQFYICEEEQDDLKIRLKMNKNKKIQDLQNIKQLNGCECQFYYKNQLVNKQETFKQIKLNNQDIIYYKIK